MTQLPGDWPCSVCGVNNFAARKICFKCRKGKYVKPEAKISPEEQEKMMAERWAYYTECEERNKRDKEEKKKKKEEEMAEWRWVQHQKWPDAQDF